MSTVELSIDDVRKEWLKKRVEGIGGSDAAAVLGVSPYKSALNIYTEKLGLADYEEDDIPEYVEIGAELEGFIARRYAKQTGRNVRVPVGIDDPARFAIQKHPEHSFMICTLDGFIDPVDDRGPGVLELKNVIGFKESDWYDEPPLHFQIQIQHNMAVTGLTWGSFGVFFGGNKVRHYDVSLNGRFVESLIREESDFWRRVQEGDPPIADGSDSSADALMRLFPKDLGETIHLPESVIPMRDEFREVKAKLKELEERKSLLRNQIAQMIGGATIGILPDGTGFSFSTTDKGAYVVAATSYRTLREIKAKRKK